MGFVKQMMMEREQYDWEDAPVIFLCPSCGKESDGHAELPKIYDDHTYEINVDVEVQCIWCDEHFCGEFQKDAAGYRIVFDEYPETKVDCEPEYHQSELDDDWYDQEYLYDRPLNPFLRFEQSYYDLKALIKMHAVQDGHASMNRMFFTQSFSIFETYLCDSFLKLVFLTDDNQRTFIKKHPTAKDTKVSLGEMMKRPDMVSSKMVEEKITPIIKESLFHNLGKVNGMFKMFGIELFPEKIDKDMLLASVGYRHHAVHRNGYDKEGIQLEVYTKDYILSIVDTMMLIARNLDEEISKAELA